MRRLLLVVVASFAVLAILRREARSQELAPLQYQHPGLVVDLGVGLWAWPLPMDYDGDGDLDLVVSCPDKPRNGTWLFENPHGNVPMPVFKPPVRLGPGYTNVRPSYVGNDARILTPGQELVGYRTQKFGEKSPLGPPSNIHGAAGRVRANQWSLVDWDGDDALDLVIGVGDWTEYGWDDAFDENGNWTRGPLHGYVYWLRNQQTTDEPEYTSPQQLTAGDEPVDVYGMPSPCIADFDSDGDLDLLCGEFLDGFTYFQNTGNRTDARLAPERRLVAPNGQPLHMDLQMIVPVALDWDRDGDVDLIVGDEDGRVAFVEHTGRVSDGLPIFHAPRYFQQHADEVKFGALVTPFSFDWDGDGDEDLLCGNTAGYIGLIENLDGGNPPRWAAPVRLTVDEEPIRIQAGKNGSIQGPCEAKWGYSTLSVADWDADGLSDLVVNSIWGRVEWYRNIGTRQQPRLAKAQHVRVNWPGTPPKPAWNWWDPKPDELATQWRTTPLATDWNADGLCDLVMLDHEGYLALFERTRQGARLVLQPGQRLLVDEALQPIRLNDGYAGKSGRRKLALADWDGDGRVDLLVNGKNADWWRNVRSLKDGRTVLRSMGPLAEQELAGHTTSPTTVDWDRNGVPDLLIGAEDGYLYYMRNPRTESGVTQRK